MPALEPTLRAPVRGGRGATRRKQRRSRIPPAGAMLGRAAAAVRRALLLATAAGLVGGVVLAAPQLHALVDRPVTRVEVSGELLRLDSQQVRDVIASFDLQSLFGLELVAMRDAIESLQWVRLAGVRRVWPDSLQVRVVEQTPIAVWNGTGLINDRGEVFRPAEVAGVAEFAALPRLHGPDGSGRQLMQTYQRYSVLLQAQGLRLSGLRLSARGAWDVELASGVRVRLGRDTMLERLQRFTVLHKSYLAQRMDEVAEVDARYERGLAVSWKGEKEKDDTDAVAGLAPRPLETRTTYREG